MANIVTGCRILCSIGMLFFPAFSSGFFYLISDLRFDRYGGWNHCQENKYSQ